MNAPLVRTQNSVSVILGPVVHDDDFIGRSRLRENRIQSKGKQCRAVVARHDDANSHEAISRTADGGESPPVPATVFGLCQNTREERTLRRADLTLTVRGGDAKGPYRLPLKD